MNINATKMADWFDKLTSIAWLVADSKAIIGGAGGLALISAAGLIPRVGFGRAITLGWRSYFKTTSPLSVRKSEIQKLNDSILCMVKGSYITVIGGKGNGKSCLIDTALNRHFGVVKISVSNHLLSCIIIVFSYYFRLIYVYLLSVLNYFVLLPLDGIWCRQISHY